VTVRPVVREVAGPLIVALVGWALVLWVTAKE
jgi:hypothetical protein